ncbi:MarR family winged helix-turn-helix transcriptional regulator [Marinobacter sp.]|uniref:MarR family winged helix-turn-helix transcriptional regulator n=1 Tax=Marinobacter sp. TaxID=50741 RepID=UPI0019ED1052|nr:MarR family transcriptional regulator [Marinobacter sp.]MBE0484559.1 MarR family transcriptional regulator [Marinobacter sp.]
MAVGDDVLGLDNQICFALYALNRAVTARYRPLLTKLDLTYPQYLVMLVLWEREQGEPARVSDVGDRLRLDSGTLTPLLKRLEQRGLVIRRRQAGDERVVRLGLTEAGWQLRAAARQVPEQLLCGLDVDPQRLIALRQELRSLLAILEAPASSDQ